MRVREYGKIRLYRDSFRIYQMVTQVTIGLISIGDNRRDIIVLLAQETLSDT
jgi:hypothetical protein